MTVSTLTVARLTVLGHLMEQLIGRDENHLGHVLCM